jgi:hypothetical protein
MNEAIKKRRSQTMTRWTFLMSMNWIKSRGRVLGAVYVARSSWSYSCRRWVLASTCSVAGSGGRWEARSGISSALLPRDLHIKVTSQFFSYPRCFSRILSHFACQRLVGCLCAGVTLSLIKRRFQTVNAMKVQTPIFPEVTPRNLVDMYQRSRESLFGEKAKLRGLSPQANYTDRATAACRWS